MERNAPRVGQIVGPRQPGARQGAGVVFGVLLLAFSCLAWPRMAVADSTGLAVTATVLSKSNCRFDSRSSTLDFGAIDPAGTSDVRATVAVSYVCRGSAPVAAFFFTRDDGLHPAGAGKSQMRHATDASAYLPYSLSLTPVSGTVPKNVHRDLTVTGTVRATDYRTAIAGSYSDSVTLTILP